MAAVTQADHTGKGPGPDSKTLDAITSDAQMVLDGEGAGDDPNQGRDLQTMYEKATQSQTQK